MSIYFQKLFVKLFLLIFFNIEHSKNKQDFSHLMCFVFFRKGSNVIQTQKKKNLFSLWRRYCEWLNLSKMICEVSYWKFLTPWSVNRLRLTVNNWTYLAIKAKHSNQELKIIWTNLVMLVFLMCGFHINKKTYRTVFLCLTCCLNIMKTLFFKHLNSRHIILWAKLNELLLPKDNLHLQNVILGM